MHMEYTAVVKRCGEWWIGWIEEVPGVNCQERTHEELRQSLADALAEALEFNRRDALAAAGDDYREDKTPRGSRGRRSGCCDRPARRACAAG